MSMEEDFTLSDLNVTLDNRKCPKWKKQLIIGALIGLFLIILIIIIILIETSGSNESKLKSVGEFNCIYEFEDSSNAIPILSKEFK